MAERVGVTGVILSVCYKLADIVGFTEWIGQRINNDTEIVVSVEYGLCFTLDLIVFIDNKELTLCDCGCII